MFEFKSKSVIEPVSLFYLMSNFFDFVFRLYIHFMILGQDITAVKIYFAKVEKRHNRQHVFALRPQR